MMANEATWSRHMMFGFIKAYRFDHLCHLHEDAPTKCRPIKSLWVPHKANMAYLKMEQSNA